MRTPARFAVVATAAVIVLAALSPTIAATSCPAGFERLGTTSTKNAAAFKGVKNVRAISQWCVNVDHPESAGEIMMRNRQANAARLAPLTSEPEGAYAASLDQRAAIIAAAPAVAGAGGKWTPYGKTPLLSNDDRYGTYEEGLGELNGRVDSLDYDPVSKRLFATGGGNGGVWMSSDLGGKWTSIGDNLPSQIVGAVAWSPAKGGTVIALGGEPLQAFGSRTGLGAYYSRDLGESWHKARGIPRSILGFNLAVDPSNPSVVYAATSKGLYRSADGGAIWVNVKLPTGNCEGKTDEGRCLLSNMVTDVVVQGPDTFGHEGGAVLAVVGYRAGKRPFPSDPSLPESANNGLYRSDHGLPGTFEQLPGSGFTPQERIGRTELGVATGPEQNHGYVYAIVEDAVVFQGGYPTIDAPSDVWPGVSVSSLNGIYVSGDFGSTWTQMADQAQIALNPATGSSFVGVGQALMNAPGVQAWYNEWIKPDPTRQDENGVPTRLAFGLEEIWENVLTDQPADGQSAFHVIGRYFAGGSCMLLPLGVPVCPTAGDVSPSFDSTTHPDQHDAIWVPDGIGGVTLVAGNDGGAYTQHADLGVELDNQHWGSGANRGFNTLLPYMARIAKDGTVWMGLQDNGSAKIEPDTRKQIMAFGGDGFFVAVDPNNSSYAWSETPSGSMRVTTDGGITWHNQPSGVTNAQFSNPFMMDPLDSNHLLTAGTEVMETVDGPTTCTNVGDVDLDEEAVNCTWVEVFNLGTKAHPGVAGSPGDGDAANQVSALDVYGAASYVGFCGPCDIMNTDIPFTNGLATNVGGSAPGAPASSDGWHIASASGLNNRTITSVAIDPADPKTVFVTLGGYARGWRGPGSFGDENRRIGRGHVFVSHDAGEHFVDISRGLPDAPANWVTLRGSQLVVATDVGVFLSADLRGTLWAALSKGLPVTSATSVQVKPGDDDTLIVSTFGRGVYSYSFPSGAVAPVVKPRPKPPAVVKGIKKTLPATGLGDPLTIGVLLTAAAMALQTRLRRGRSRSAA